MTLAREIDVNVTLNVTWLRGSTVIGNDTISDPSSLNVFTSVHTLSSLDANDNNITCLAKIFPEGTSLFLTSSLPHSVSKLLDIEGKSCFSLLQFNIIIHVIDPNITVMTMPSENIHNIGDKFNITCMTVSDLAHLNPEITYQWVIGHYGNESVLTANSTISFPSLTLSDAGEYTCKVNVSSGLFTTGYALGMKNYSLRIRSKPNT